MDFNKQNLKIVLIILGPFYVGWAIIQALFYAGMLTRDHTAFLTIAFILCWGVYALVWGVHSENQAKKIAEMQREKGDNQ